MKLSQGVHGPARIAVVGLHLALFALLWQHRPPALQTASERRVVTLRLLPLPQRRAAPPDPALTPAAPRPLAPPPMPTSMPPVPLVAPWPSSAEPAPALPSEPAPAPPPAPAPAETPRTTLRLTLPPGYAASSAAARNPALTDPRSNTARPTLEDRIGDATGGAGAWVEERTSDYASQAVGALGDRRTVLRRGDTCVEVHRSRIADSDPFNGSVAPRTAPMVGKPYKCR